MLIGRQNVPASWWTARRLVMAGIAVVVATTAAVLVAGAAYHTIYANRIFPGVSAAGVPLGGVAPASAEALLHERLSPSTTAALIVRANGQSWTFSRASLGAHYDVKNVVDLAYQVGRQGPLLGRLVAPLALVIHGDAVAADMLVDSSGWNDVLGPIASKIDRPAVDATLIVGSDERLHVTPDQQGYRLDLNQSRQILTRAILEDASVGVNLPVQKVDPRLRVADLARAQSLGDRILSNPLTLSYEGQIWQLSPHQLAMALDIPKASDLKSGKAVQLDPAYLASFVRSVAATVDRPAQSARLRLEDSKIVLDHGQSSRAFQVDETVTRLQVAATGSARTVSPVITERPPTVLDSDLTQAAQLANTMLSGPISLRFEDLNVTITPAQLRSMLVLPSDPVAQRDAGPTLDSKKLAAYVADYAKKVDRDPIDARFDWANGALKVIRDGQSGRQLDQNALVQAIQAAAVSTDRSVLLPVKEVAPKVQTTDRDKLVGAQLIANSVTSYAGSIPPRKHNVELATSRLNGVVLAPGELFSFNREEGPTTLDSGFQVGFGILAEGDSVKTVPSVAGGICQVATTLFQPVFWSGYQIESRYSHAYWIEHYRSHGYPGLDTTVDAPSGLDFQFFNNTPNYLLIRAYTDGTNVHFSLYGTLPTWKVTVDKPVISNVVKTDTAWQIQKDPTMLSGQRIITEAAEDGYDVTIRRVVTDGSGDRVLALRSHYEPSHNVVLVGTKGAPPAPAATPATSPTPTKH